MEKDEQRATEFFHTPRVGERERHIALEMGVLMGWKKRWNGSRREKERDLWMSWLWPSREWTPLSLALQILETQ